METAALQKKYKTAAKPKSDSFFKPVVQKKLRVGKANDSYEVEADRVADSVMKMPKPTPQVAHTETFLQRKCTACEQEEKLQMKPLAGSITPLIRRSSAENGRESDAPDHVESRINSSRGNGSSMDHKTKNFMESRFDTDFSDVKIHAGSEAAQMSRELNAEAFTVGNDIYFNEGKYNPSSNSGKHLLAHELTHTVQQGGGVGRKVQKKVINENVVTNDAIEKALSLTRNDIIDALNDANQQAIILAQNSINTLTAQLNNSINGNSVDADAELILTEELGLSFLNRRHRGLIRQQINRFRRVKAILESGELRYLALGIGSVKIVGCSAGSCGNEFASSCPANRLIVLCQSFWNTPDEMGVTLLHETFHIRFDMMHTNNLRRANATCFESFAMRVSGYDAPVSCVSGAS